MLIFLSFPFQLLSSLVHPTGFSFYFFHAIIVLLSSNSNDNKKETECKGRLYSPVQEINPFLPTVAFNICCPRDCVSRHNGGTAGAPLKPLRDDSALRALLSLRGLRGAPAVPPLCRETQSLGQQMLNATVGTNGLIRPTICRERPVSRDSQCRFFQFNKAVQYLLLNNTCLLF